MRQIRGTKAQMGPPPDAPLPGKTLRRLIRSGAPGSMGPDTFLLEQTFLSEPKIYLTRAPWLAATRAVDSALSQFGRQTRTKPRKSYKPAVCVT